MAASALEGPRSASADNIRLTRNDKDTDYLGGCVVTDDDPYFACTGFDCGLHF